MNKEEQLKIYSAYLPYGLKGHLLPQTHEVELTGIYLDDFERHEVYIKPSGCYAMTRFKPILYDLSYLTKEIEHEGERFVPIVELLKIKYPNQQGRYAETEYVTIGYPFACFSVDAGKTIRVNTSDLENQPFWIIKKLLEWHFNVFGLSEDQFINKATLKP